jgi:murein L,D-transpeptidase YafK
MAVHVFDPEKKQKQMMRELMPDMSRELNAILSGIEAGACLQEQPLLVQISKGKRQLTLLRGGETLLTCRVGLGRCPKGRKQQEGDGRTPEGEYAICLVKEAGKYGRSLGLNYPNRRDADIALREGRIDLSTHLAIMNRLNAGVRPPWGTPLGGEIYIHEGGSDRDWTEGCIALDEKDMDVLFAHREKIGRIVIEG